MEFFFKCRNFLNYILTYCHLLNFFFLLPLLADSLEDHASLNISPFNRTRAANISLRTDEILPGLIRKDFAEEEENAVLN